MHEWTKIKNILVKTMGNFKFISIMKKIICVAIIRAAITQNRTCKKIKQYCQILLFQIKMHKLFYNQQGFLLLFCWIFVAFSCLPTEQNLSVPAIEADVTSNAELKLSEYFKNFRMLKLPTDTVMGEIEKIKYENNQIYISDGQTLFVFSEDGKLLSCFKKRGEGPGEYASIEDFMVDGETITVLDRNQQKLLTYDHLGNSISTRNLEYYAQAISPKVDNSFFLYNGSDINYKLHRIREGVEDSMYLAVDENQAKYLFIFAHHNFYQYQKSIYFFQPINDTIYKSVDGGKIKPSFYVDFKGKNIPASFLKRPYKDIKDFFDELFKASYAYGVYSFVMSDRFIMFGSFYQKDKRLTVFDRKNKFSSTFATIKDDICFNGLTIPISKFIYHANKNKHIIVPLDAFSVVEWRKIYSPSEQFEKMVNATQEEDNPLLLIFDFKQ